MSAIYIIVVTDIIYAYVIVVSIFLYSYQMR